MAGLSFMSVLVVMNYFRSGLGAQQLLRYTAPYIIGVTVFLGLVYHSRGDVYLYDEVTNQTTVIGDVPDAITTPMAMLNSIERYVVDIIDTTMTPGHPERYGVSAGGIYSAIIYQALANNYAIYGDNNRPDSYLSYTVQRYIEDCLFFANQAGRVSIDDVKQKSIDFTNELAASVHNSIYTIVQKDEDGWRDESNALTCNEAWNGGTATAGTWAGLRIYLTDSAKFDGMLEQVCSSIGYDMSNAQEKLACQNMMGGITDYTHGGTLSMSWFEFIRQIYLAHKINEALTTYAPGTATAWLSNLENMSTTTGIAIVANEWMPVIKGVVTGVAFFLTPFIIMFFTTHLFPRALMTVMMFFIWLTLWTIMDVGMHGFAVDYAYNIYELVRANNSLGYDQIMMMPNAAVKGMAISGIVRSSSMALATVFTGLMFKGYGSVALSALSGNLAGHMRTSGGEAGSTVHQPAKVSQRISGVESSVPTIANAARFDFSRRTTAGTYRKANNIQSGLQTSRHFKGAFEAAKHTGFAAATTAAGGVSYANAVGGPAGSERKREMDGLSEKAYTDRGYGDRNELARIGAESRYHATRQHSGEVLNEKFPGLFKSSDSAHQYYARMKASRDMGWFNQANMLAMSEIGRKSGFSAPEGPNKITDLSSKASAFISNLQSGNREAIAEDPEQSKAFQNLTGQNISEASNETMQKTGNMLQTQSLKATVDASDTMGTMFPARYAAEKHKMDYINKHHGIKDLQSLLAFNNSVEALNKTTTAETKHEGLQKIADDHFGGDIGKASKAVSDAQVWETYGNVKEHLRLGNDPGNIKSVMGQIRANIETGTGQAFEIIGDEGLQQVSMFKDLNVTAKAEQSKYVAAAALNKAPEDVTGEDILQVQKGHHGSNWVTTNESGTQSYVIDSDGNVLFSTSKQLLNAQGVSNLADKIESRDPAAAGKLREYLNNSNQDLSYEATITQDAQGNIATYDIKQPRSSTSSVVMESSEKSSVTIEDTPLKTDANTVWNKVQSMDSSFAETLLSGTRAEQDTMARDVSNMLATNLFLSRHGVDTEEHGGQIGIGSGASFTGKDIFSTQGIKNLIGRALSVNPNANLYMRATNSYREEIDKIAKDIYDEISGHQEMVRDKIWTREFAADQLSINIKATVREYKSKEKVSDDTRRGKDVLPFSDNR